MIDPKLIGSRIRELRKKRGLTQGEFASIISVSFQAVSNWERGIAPPDIENLMIIASYFGVLVDSLIAPVGEDIYVGIDGGGTKTEFVAVTRAGCAVKRVTKAGCNPNDIGISETESLIRGGLDEIIREYPSVKGVFAGIAGAATGNYAEKLRESLSRLYPRIEFQVKSDAFNIFGLYDKADMALISGTGSVLLVKTADGYERLGGWGHLFDSAGSAYDIGREAVRHALWLEERRKTPTKLYKMLLEKMGCATVWSHINSLYSGGRAYVASFASVVFSAYQEGDECAIDIIDESARALAGLLNAGVELYGAKPVAVASGGLFEHHAQIMQNHIAKYSDVRIRMSGLPPIYGACRIACISWGGELPDSFYENFRRTYGELGGRSV